MKNPNQSEVESLPSWAFIVALPVLLYLMYSSTFLTDYLMNDEWLIGPQSDTIITLMTRNYFTYGRALFGLYRKLVYAFAGYSTVRIEFIRFANFASLAIVAVLLLAFLQQGRMKNRWLAFLTVVFFTSQLPFQALMGYSLQLISNTLPAIWLSLLAFYLFFFAFPRRRWPAPLQAGTVFIILLLAMQSTQTYAFFCTIPIAYLALSDWKNQKRRIAAFLAIAFVVFALSTLTYKVSLDLFHQRGGQGYTLGEEGIAALTGSPASVVLNALNPLAYWSAFKLWTCPYPLSGLSPIPTSLQRTMAVALMILWLGLVSGCLWSELRTADREERLAVLSKWLAVLACFCLAAFFVIADSPTKVVDHRPHILLTFSGLVCFVGAYALDHPALHVPFLRSRGFAAMITAGVLLVAAGAQAGVVRNLVETHKRQVDFVRSALLSEAPDSYDRVLVVMPSADETESQTCITEPCGPWFGDVIEDPWHLQTRGLYRYALATIGAIPQDKKISFVSQLPAVIPPRTVILDWNAFLRSLPRTG